jgi:hypothetical protein
MTRSKKQLESERIDRMERRKKAAEEEVLPEEEEEEVTPEMC